jgi:hypothetical protein
VPVPSGRGHRFEASFEICGGAVVACRKRSKLHDLQIGIATDERNGRPLHLLKAFLLLASALNADRVIAQW